MALTLIKHTHACVRIEDGDRALVIDPGVFSPEGELPVVLDGASAVLITHKHVDHLNPEALKAARAANPSLEIYAPAGVAAQIADLAPTVTTAGTSFTAAGFPVRTFGGHHAVIHPLVALGYVDNVGYLIGSDSDTIYHPGDALVVPDAPVGTLLIPAHAPWSKAAELIDFTIAVRPTRAHQIHDGLLNDRGQGLIDNLLKGTTAGYGTTYSRLGVGESTTVG